MVATLRYFLLVLLVGLQLVAPLVHAHVGKVASGSGWHLPELDALQSKHADFDDWLVSDTAYTLGVGSAIQWDWDATTLAVLMPNQLMHDLPINSPPPLIVSVVVSNTIPIPPPLAQHRLVRAPPV